MAKQSAAFELTLPPQASDTATYEWLYQVLRTEILEGRLRGGTRLPSSRDLAKRYRLSRGTIVNAFELLKSEGYLRGSTGSGTFVSDVLPDELLKVKPKSGAHTQRSLPRRHLAAYGRRVQYESNFEAQPMRAFRANLPAIDLFPMKLWSTLASRRMRTSSDLLIGCDPIGYPPLREAVADYLNAWRGVKCSPEQILIVSGVQEAIDIVARVVLDARDRVCVEDPGYPAARMVFEAAGAKVIPVPVDAEGIGVDDRRMRGARLVFVTPGHQSPLGVTMSLRRRLALLEWAQRNEALIFEDDYDSEYRYSSRPMPALQGMDRNGNVVFAGSFNKVLFPSLRLGYVVAPADLIARFEAVKSITSRHAQLFDQAVLCDFIAGGHFARHLRRMREIYAERLAALLKAVREHLAGVLEVPDIEAGLQTVAWLSPNVDANVVEQRSRAQGLHVTALSKFAIAPLSRDGIQLGFAAITPAQIRRGVHDLARVLDTLADS
ncbi:MAG TPA: PLP-dependent aminotransferase family protein [Candidatus Baltobacteraceae bacterium]|nr:PLP-dependent aminotransferase family protein [Candidatus Baltobacteraceae bacterium]